MKRTSQINIGHMEKDQYRSQFRLPWSLYTRLEKSRTNKSLNAEIVARLESSFEQESRLARLEAIAEENSAALQQCLAILTELRK